MWIGLNDLDVENYYQWSDGSPVTITKWFWDEPKLGVNRLYQQAALVRFIDDKPYL